jgi:3-methyladenine DNA glycosylase/8-oxoguanine DNA glycosylase
MSSERPTVPLALPRTALGRLRRADPALARLIKRVGPFTMTVGRGHHLEALIRSIVYQQLSGKAAATIHGRLMALVALGGPGGPGGSAPQGSEFPSAASILSRSDAELRACGLSAQKLSYLRDLCSRVHDGRLDLTALDELSDAEVLARLVEVRGFGRWSAEMFLMFQLGRLDLWPVDDLGVRKAMMKLRGLDEPPSRRELEALGEPYRPYRTVASWYLWRLLDLPAEEQDALFVP